MSQGDNARKMIVCTSKKYLIFKMADFSQNSIQLEGASKLLEDSYGFQQ